MDCKLLRKCHKEEAPAGVVAVVMQCTKGTVLSWAPYLLNLFLEYCRDAQGFWDRVPLFLVVILIALVAWENRSTQPSFIGEESVCNKVYSPVAQYRSEEEER
jgi:hypothetical protein